MLARNLRAAGSQRAMVALVSQNTHSSARKQLEDENIRVIEVPDVFSDLHGLPSGRNLCESRFKRMYLWDPSILGDYDRVMYLEPDTLPVLNMDELFLCGRFCMILDNMFFYTTGLLVVKPDADMYAALRDSLTAYDVPARYRASSAVPHILGLRIPGARPFDCQDEAERFFLDFFHPLEDAPLFSPSAGQSDAPRQRLAVYYHLNAMLYYEKLNFLLASTPNYRAINASIPAHALGFTSIKPFSWAPALFFDLHWAWQEARSQLVPDSLHTGRFLAAAALCLIPAAVLLHRWVILLYNARPAARNAVVSFSRRANELLGPDVLGTGLGVLLAVLLGRFVVAPAIPQLTHPRAAWGVFIIAHTLAFRVAIKLFDCAFNLPPAILSLMPHAHYAGAAAAGTGTQDVQLLPLTAPNPEAPVPASNSGVSRAAVAALVAAQLSPSASRKQDKEAPLAGHGLVPISWFLIPAAWQIGIYAVLALPPTVFGSFPYKIVVLYAGVGCVLIAYANIARSLFRAFHFACALAAAPRHENE